jgi:hypothetical protein
VFILILIVPFEFCDICEPFLVWFVCRELSVQDVFRYELRIIRLACASVVRILDRGLDVSGSADPENSLVVDLYAMVTIQVIIDPAVSLSRVHHMDLFDLLSYESILPDSFTNIAAQPLVIC